MSAEKETRGHPQIARALSFGPLAKLLAGAALLHAAATFALFLAGRYSLLPEYIGQDGVGSFAPDGVLYIREVRLLVEELWTNGPDAWLAAPFPVHSKLYSLCFAALSWCFGFTILCAEPLNLLCYLAILANVYWLGKECFDERAGLMSAAAVALWPSFLLHTTQLLKDPMFIVAMLALVATSVRLLMRSYSLVKGLRVGLAGGAAVAAVWLVRDQAWTAALTVPLAAAGLMAVRRVREGSLPAGNVGGAALLVVLSFCVPFLAGPYRNRSPRSPAGRATEAETISRLCSERFVDAEIRVPPALAFSRLRREVLRSRIAATCRTVSGSNIDVEVELYEVKDIVLYLPRAAMIGFFAPFPGMWFARGSQVGLAGSVLSGAEMLAIYLIELLALAWLWAARRRLAVWLLAFVSAAGITALGLVMPNIGTLYRLRYVFVILLVVLAAGGTSLIISRRTWRGGRAVAAENSSA